MQQVPRQKPDLRLAIALYQPRRQQQQRTEMIFRLILLHLKRDIVLTHPLAQRGAEFAVSIRIHGPARRNPKAERAGHTDQ